MSQDVLAVLEQLVVNGPPGQRLPAERVLAASLGVSRTDIRRALRALEAREMIQTRPQAGSFISRSYGQPTAGARDSTSSA